MSYTKRKLMGLLTLGTATLGTVSSGVTSAGWLNGVKNFFNPTTQTKEMKKQSNRIIDASRGYGAAINLANIISEHNKEGVIDLLKKELDIFSENENNTELDVKDLSEDQLLKKGNALLKIAYDLDIKEKEIIDTLTNLTTHKRSKKGLVVFGTDKYIETGDEGFYSQRQSDNPFQENDNEELNSKKVHGFPLYLSEDRKLSFNGANDFIIQIMYWSLEKNNNIKAVKEAIGKLDEKIFKKLKDKNKDSDTLKNGISSIMQVICEQKGSKYFEEIIKKLMDVEVTDESNKKKVIFKESSQFKQLIEIINKKEESLSYDELPKNAQDGNNKIEVVKEMIKFSDKGGVLFEVLDSLGYTRSASGRFFDNKYVRVTLGVGAAVGIAYVAGVPLLSIGFAKLAVGCLAATTLLDLRHQNFGTWAWSNIKSAATTTATIVKGVGSIIGKGMTIFEGYKW